MLTRRIGRIFKHHRCRQPADDCACPWKGRYRHREVTLAKWIGHAVVTRRDAEKALAAFVKAVDDGTYERGRAIRKVTTGTTLSALIDEWTTHYADKHGLTATSLRPMLGVLKNSPLGQLTLAEFAEESTLIERELDALGDERQWKAVTWNKYHGLLYSISEQATKWKAKGKPRLTANPMRCVALRRAVKPEHFKQRIEEDIEARLFTAVNQLRHAAAMRRRLIAAFDGGLRLGEMQRVQMKHVNWRPVTIGTATAYVITLPPTITKGGKTSGETESIYAATPRFREMLDTRRFQLRNDPEGYIFGTEGGGYQADFDKSWRRLFTLAGLPWGRPSGMVWHTIRHEFTSRIAENTGDPVLTQELARHKDLETTQLYMKAREHRKLTAAAGLSR